MERQNDLDSVRPKSEGDAEAGPLEEAKKKEAILTQVKELPGSIKETLERIGLAQSTYYGWSKKYKKEGLEGLLGGSPVSDEVWDEFVRLSGKEGRPAEGDIKGRVKETDVMANTDEQDRRKEILFRRFGDDASKTSGTQTGATGAGESAGPSGPSGYEPPPEEPMDKTVKYVIGAFVFVVAVLLVASFSNSSNYYFKTNNQMIELWKGRFAPMGEVKVATFSDPKIIEGVPEQESYSKKEAYGVLFDYLMNEADQVLDTERTPDLKTVKSYLAHAAKYAVSEEDRSAIRTRLNSIDFLVLSGKADLALTKGSPENFEAARDYLEEALDLATTEIREDTVERRLSAIDDALTTWEKGTRDKSLIELYRDSLAKSGKKEGPGKAGKDGPSAAYSPSALLGAGGSG